MEGKEGMLSESQKVGQELMTSHLFFHGKKTTVVNVQGQVKGKGKSSLIEVMHGITQLM